jgi:hypothetical protein
MNKYLMCSRGESEFEHIISPINEWTIEENNPDFRGFVEGLYFEI